MTARALAVVFVLVLALAPASHVRAQDADARREEARAEFHAGTAAFEADDFAGALDHYQRAFELGPRDAVRFNIAVCLERLGRFRRAADEYRLASESPELDEAARQRAREQLALVRQRLGTITIDGAPGTRVELDGEPLCIEPCVEEIDPGAHTLRGRALDGAELDQRIELARGQTLALELVPLAAAPDTDAEAETEMTTDEPPPPPPSVLASPGPLAITGSVLTLVGAAAAVALGVRTSDLSASYDRAPTSALRDEGLATEGGFHGALALAAIGGVLVLVEIALDLTHAP